MQYLAPIFAAAVAAAAPHAGASHECADLSFPVYFAHGAAAVSSLARQVVSEAAGQIAACPVREILLTPEEGLESSSSSRQDLSLPRAQAVAQALASAGVDAGLIRIAYPSAAADGEPLPPRVRVQVILAPRPAPPPPPRRLIV